MKKTKRSKTESEPSEDPKRCSLVDSLEDALCGHRLGGPEPDYLQWLDSLLFAEVGSAAEAARYEKNTVKEREAWRIYGDAVSATHDLLILSRRDKPLFQKIARCFSVLPGLMSHHPESKAFNQKFFKNSQIGIESMLCEQALHGQHHAYQSSPVRYAYALITTIDLTLDRFKDRLPIYAEIYGYGVKNPVDPEEIEEILARGQRTEQQKEKLRRSYSGAYRILPKWTKGLGRLQKRLSRESVLAYWRKGKEIMLEEMPDFHLRPEWKNYHFRLYADGAKAGVIQHAIFKDILAAFRTIAGANKQMKKNGKAGRRARPVK